MSRNPRRPSRKFNPTDPIGSVDYVTHHVDTTSTIQNVNFIIATCELRNRRTKRQINYFEQYLNTGVEPSILEKVLWWFWDYLVFALELIWGFFDPFLGFLFRGLLRTVMILLLYVLLFSALIASCHHL